MLRTDGASLRFFRQRIASFLSPRTDSASLRLVAEAIAVRDTRHSFAPVPPLPASVPVTTRETSQIGGRTRGACPTTGLRCYSPATLPTGNAGRNRHEPASKVSAPADIQGGDAVSDGKPFGRSDALSVRTMRCRFAHSEEARGNPAGCSRTHEARRRNSNHNQC